MEEVFMRAFRLMVTAVLSMVVIFATNLAVGSSSVLDSGKSSKEIAEEILQGARKRYVSDQQKNLKEINSVVMYSTSWCGYCKKARRYFKSKGIKFVERDIERSRLAKVAYDRLGGNGVPLIVVGNNKMSGFSVRKFDRLYRLLE
jgi:glutaredoxin